MRRAVVLDEKDNVATAIADLGSGETVEVDVGGHQIRVQVRDSIPFGHKFCLREIPAGGSVVKYGEVIGRATRLIQVGEHVHVHNVESERGRGDRATARQGVLSNGGR